MADASDYSSPPGLQALLDKEAIRETPARYCRGVDRKDLALTKTVYFEDATEDHGNYRGNAFGFVDLDRSGPPVQEIVHHCLGQTLIDLQGDRAFCETYFICGIVMKGEDGSRWLIDVRGRYLDNMERRNGDWKITERVAVVDMSEEGRPAEPEWSHAPRYVRGVFGPGDLVFRPDQLRARLP